MSKEAYCGMCSEFIFLPLIKEGSVAKKAEDDKDWKYRFMTNEFHFVPICVETMGVWGPKGCKFIKEVGKLISDKTMERRSTSYLRQSIFYGNTKGKLR